MARVLVTRRITGDALDRLRNAHDVTVLQDDLPPSPEALREHAADANALIPMLTDTIDEQLLQAAPHLTVVANYAVGTDNVDLDACRARGVAVGRTPDVLTDATADLTWALILAVARRLPEAAEAVRQGEWRTFETTRWLGTGLDGKRLLIVGAGRIGTAVARRGEAFGMEPELLGRGGDLHGALARAHVISLHAPLTGATRELIDDHALHLVRPDAILVNTARGPLVDTRALARALHDGRLAGAGLDVTDPEPLPSDHPILDAPNALVLPHVGSATREARAAMTALAVANVEAGLAGEPLPHPA